MYLSEIFVTQAHWAFKCIYTRGGGGCKYAQKFRMLCFWHTALGQLVIVVLLFKSSFCPSGGTFKQRYYNHQLSLRDRRYSNSTELWKYSWKLKESNKVHNINWSIHRRAAAYTNKSKRCNLCLAEKLAIIRTDKSRSLNKRSELVTNYRHENKFYLRNFTPTVT